MDDKTFEQLMESLEEAVNHVKGKKTKVTVTRWEIKPVKVFSASAVKRIRKNVRLSQPLFAELLGVSVKTVRSWEQGLSTPSRSSARLLEALDRSKDQCLSLYRDIDVISKAVGE